MTRFNEISRRQTIILGASVITAPNLVFAADRPLVKRPIPHGGELLPAVGLGTANGFDEAGRTQLDAVIKTLIGDGGSIIDTAPSYGNAESVIGDILTAQNARAGA